MKKYSYKLFFLIAIFFSNQLLIAQEQLQHEKKMIKTSEGKIFINKDLGVYLWVSTSTDPNSKKYLLDSETPEYSNPFYFYTEGKNMLRTPSKVDKETKRVVIPKEDLIFEVYVDGVAPKTDLKYGNTIVYQVGEKTYCGQGFEVKIASKDAVSGVDKIYLSINGEAYKEYTEPLKITEEMEYTFKYYAVDKVGNVENVKTKTITSDFTSPQTSVDIAGGRQGNIFSPRVKLKFLSNEEAGQKTYYSIDDLPQKIFTGTIPLSYLKEGAHTLKYYSIDKLGNKENEQVFEFFIDKTPPLVVTEIMGNQFEVNGKTYTSGRTKFKLTAVDNKAGVKAVYYSIGNEEFKPYEKPFYLPAVSGNISIRYYAIDNVNNKSSSNKNAGTNSMTIPYVDLTGPVISHFYQGDKFQYDGVDYISPRTKIKLKGIDSESGFSKFTYAIDSAVNEVDYENYFTIDKAGEHKIGYTGYDYVENSNRKTFNVFVDDKAPEISTAFSIVKSGTEERDGKTIDAYPKHLILFVMATDNCVGLKHIYYSINEQATQKYTGMISGFSKNNYYKINIKATDNLNNESQKSIEFYIK